MKPTPLLFPTLRGNLEALRYPAIAEVKMDGECELVTFEHDEARLVNKYNTQRRDLPVLKALTQHLTGQNIQQAVFLAELYHGNGKNGALYELLKDKHGQGLHLLVFDILELNRRTLLKSTLLERKDILLDILPVEWTGRPQIVFSRSDALSFFQETTKKGFEGIVIKNLNERYLGGPCLWVKMKHKDTSTFPVVEISKSRERIEVLVTTPGKQVKVGVKVSNSIKRTLKEGDIVEVEHQGILPSGSLRHPVFKRITTKGTPHANAN